MVVATRHRKFGESRSASRRDTPTPSAIDLSLIVRAAFPQDVSALLRKVRASARELGFVKAKFRANRDYPGYHNMYEGHL